MGIIDAQKVYDYSKDNTANARNQAFMANQQQLAQNNASTPTTGTIDTNGMHGTPVVGNSQKSVAQGANNGTTTQQPVRRNVFGKGMTIEQKQANEDANSRATDNDFLQAAASDNLEGHRYEQDVINHGKDMAIYNADAPDLKESEKKLYDTKAPLAPDYNTHHVEDFQRQQQSQLNWGADPSKVANSSKNRDKEPTSWQELRDQLYGSEAERERKANNNAKVLAVGDALRHIGNLATTAWGHATPQQYKTSPAQDTLDTYKTEREQRDAKAYTYWNNLQQQKMKELENERENQKLAYDLADKDRNYQLKVGDFKLKVAKEGRDAKEAEQKLQNMLAQHDYYVAQGDYEKARAVKAKIEAEWEPKQQSAKLAHENASTKAALASANSSNQTAALTALKAKELRDKINKGDNFDMPTNDPNYVWSVDKKNSTALGNALRGMARKKAKSWGIDTDEMKTSDLLAIAYEHIDDTDVQQLLNTYGTKKKSKREADHKL